MFNPLSISFQGEKPSLIVAKKKFEDVVCGKKEGAQVRQDQIWVSTSIMGKGVVVGNSTSDMESLIKDLKMYIASWTDFATFSAIRRVSHDWNAAAEKILELLPEIKNYRQTYSWTIQKTIALKMLRFASQSSSTSSIEDIRKYSDPDCCSIRTLPKIKSNCEQVQKAESEFFKKVSEIFGANARACLSNAIFWVGCIFSIWWLGFFLLDSVLLDVQDMPIQLRNVDRVPFYFFGMCQTLGVIVLGVAISYFMKFVLESYVSGQVASYRIAATAIAEPLVKNIV